MGKFLLRRVSLLIPTLIGMSLLIFLMVRLMPGDIVDVLVGMDPTVTIAEKEQMRANLGLDKPIPVQYIKWLGDVLQGDLGISYRTYEPITEQLLRSLPITLEIAILALLMSVIVAIPLGILSAVRQNSASDLIANLVGLAGLSLPSFWLATLFLLMTSLWLHWVPPIFYISPFDDLWGNLKQFFLPSLALSVQLMAIEMRMARTAMLEVLREDYIRTAWSKGLNQKTILYRHALKNAFIPVVTVIGLQFGGLMGGSVIIEQIFGLPGVGWSMLQGVYNRDYPVIQVTSLFLAVIFVVMNLVVDVTYAYLDPRIKYG